MGKDKEWPEGGPKKKKKKKEEEEKEKEHGQRRRPDKPDSRKRRRRPVRDEAIALCHPLRHEIFAVLDETPRTLREIAGLLRSSKPPWLKRLGQRPEVPLTHIKYHLDVLRRVKMADKRGDGYVIRHPNDPPEDAGDEGPSRQP